MVAREGVTATLKSGDSPSTAVQGQAKPWGLVKRWTVYVIVPVAVSLALIGMYFSGIVQLQHVVSPIIWGMHPDSSREFGLLENLQNLCLLVILVTCVAAALRKPLRAEKAVWALGAAFTAFVLLEEIDYGLHFYELARGIQFNQAAEVRNVHNTFDLTDIMKNGALAGMLVLFVVFPLTFTNSPHAIMRYITPDRFAILTMVAMFLLRTLAHTLRDLEFGTPGSISSNISEFREFATYYLFMVYLIDIAFRRSLAEISSRPRPVANKGGL
jgi:hypothetical protein